MRRIRITIGTVHPRQLLLARGNIPIRQHPPEILQTGQRLIEGYFMPSLVDTQETEVAVLPDFAIFVAINEKGGIPGSGELLFIGVVDGKGDSFATEPVADVVGVAIEKSNSYGAIEDHLQIFDEIWICEIARHLKGIADLVVRLRIIEIDTQGVLDIGFIKIIIEVLGRCGIIIRMTDVVHAPTTKHVVRLFDVGATLISGLLAIELADFSGAVDLTASVHLSKASVEGHVAGELHVLIDGFVDELNTIAIVLGEFGVVRRLSVKVKDPITNPKGIEDELCPVRRSVPDHFILLIEIIKESWTVMTAVGFCPEIELFSS